MAADVADVVLASATFLYVFLKVKRRTMKKNVVSVNGVVHAASGFTM